MLLLSRGDRSEPAVSRSRWMSAVWVKMCFCLLFLGDFHSALSRAHSPGQGAPLLPPCAGETWQMYLDMIHSRALETGRDSLPLSLSLFFVVWSQLHFDLRTWNLLLTNTHTKKIYVILTHSGCGFHCIASFRSVNKASHMADCTVYPQHIQRMKSPEGTGRSNWRISLDALHLMFYLGREQTEDFEHWTWHLFVISAAQIQLHISLRVALTAFHIICKLTFLD